MSVLLLVLTWKAITGKEPCLSEATCFDLEV